MEPKRELVHCLEKKELRNITCSKEKLKEFRGGGGQNLTTGSWKLQV